MPLFCLACAWQERKREAGQLKTEGNDIFKRGGSCIIPSNGEVSTQILFIIRLEYAEAVKCYTDAIEKYPPSGCDHEVAACYANRAACNLKLVCILQSWFSDSHTDTFTVFVLNHVCRKITRGLWMTAQEVVCMYIYIHTL